MKCSSKWHSQRRWPKALKLHSKYVRDLYSVPIQVLCKWWNLNKHAWLCVYLHTYTNLCMCTAFMPECLPLCVVWDAFSRMKLYYNREKSADAGRGVTMHPFSFKIVFVSWLFSLSSQQQVVAPNLQVYIIPTHSSTWSGHLIFKIRRGQDEKIQKRNTDNMLYIKRCHTMQPHALLSKLFIHLSSLFFWPWNHAPFAFTSLTSGD